MVLSKPTFIYTGEREVDDSNTSCPETYIYQRLLPTRNSEN
jgi:hypothetical protein